MRLLTHNYLQSNVKGTTQGYPLHVKASLVVMEESPVDREMITGMLRKVDYKALKVACDDISSSYTQDDFVLPSIPDELPLELDDETATNLHRVLFDVHVQEGTLICPATGRAYPIKQGIPNMILHEDEI